MGGEDGKVGTVRVKHGKTLNPKGVQLIEPGQRLELLLPGGGGFGDKGQRNPAHLERDKLAGVVNNLGSE